jgi:tRNA (adenine57-N1/adenine58-N1)-methyltransferase catalytic subunit
MGEKILIRKEKKEFIPDLNKTVTITKAQRYFIDDSSKGFTTEYGSVTAKDLQKNKATTNTGKEFFVLDPVFIDYYRKIPKLAQTISLKDIGSIITTCGITRESIVAEAGTGSAGLAIFLGLVAKEVHSFDINDEYLENAKKRFLEFKLKNVKLHKQDVYANMPIKDMDVIVLDLPEPWKALEHAYRAVKKGGFIASFSPCITQTMPFVEQVNKNENLLHIKTIETIERDWKVDGKIVRPKTQVMHTAFLTFVRKLD